MGISGDGSVSAGNFSKRDADFNATAEQPYRWTATGGIELIGFLPDQDRSFAYALSSDGTTILGMSYTGEAASGELFVWREDSGMKNLHLPFEVYGLDTDAYINGSGISGNGNVIAASWYLNTPSTDGQRNIVSYITSPDKDYYVDFTEAVARAGGSKAVEGWSNFTISGVSDDGNTLYGSAESPALQQEGIIAQFPPGFLRSLTEPALLQNISSRMHVGTGEQVAIAGFIVTGNEPKRVILRGIGPSLAAKGVSDALANPVLELHKPDGTVLTKNDDWRTSQEAAIRATRVAPNNDKEAAIVASLPPGLYTVVLSGKGGTEETGLIEVYDLKASNSKLANISTRGFVGNGDNALIGGVILDAPVPARVLFRAIGPSLGAKGISGALADPLIELHNADGALVTTNDNWRSDPDLAQSIEGTGIAPTDDRESALLFLLDGGAYTAVVRGANGGTGVGLVEVYDLGTARVQ